VGVWITVVSTGSVVMDRLVTACAVAADEASARAKPEAASLRGAFMRASSLLGSNPQREAKARVSCSFRFRRDHFATQM
jgi:hypothetical protein